MGEEKGRQVLPLVPVDRERSSDQSGASSPPSNRTNRVARSGRRALPVAKGDQNRGRLSRVRSVS